MTGTSLESYNEFFVDCLRSEFIKYVGNLDGNCTLPWIQSMKGVFNYTEKTNPTCNTPDDYSVVDEYGLNFSASASAYNYSKCLGISLIDNFMSQIFDLT